MTVWLLLEHFAYEGFDILDIFTSYDKANKVLEELKKHKRYSDGITITEYEVK